MAGILNITTNTEAWSRAVKDFGTAAGLTHRAAFFEQGRLLCAELMKRTPPFSGKLMRRMADARAENEGKTFGGFADPEIESMTARAIGERRVERDIRKVIYGLRGATLAQGVSKVGTDWGTLQKCEGKQAVRVFATKAGVVYGVDLSEWKADASLADLKARHDENRTARGRVTTAGQRTIAVGRWRWLNVLVTTEKKVLEFIKLKQRSIGQGKGGWAAGFAALGGKISSNGWVGKHMRAGTFEDRSADGSVDMTITNRSRWASVGDPDRIVAAALAGRESAMAGRIERELKKRFDEAGVGR